MACVHPDGTLSPSGGALLQAVPAAFATPEELAETAGLPLFRVSLTEH